MKTQKRNTKVAQKESGLVMLAIKIVGAAAAAYPFLTVIAGIGA